MLLEGDALRELARTVGQVGPWQAYRAVAQPNTVRFSASHPLCSEPCFGPTWSTPAPNPLTVWQLPMTSAATLRWHTLGSQQSPVTSQPNERSARHCGRGGPVTSDARG